MPAPEPNITGIWRWTGATSGAFEVAGNWIDGDGQLISDYPAGRLPNDKKSRIGTRKSPMSSLRIYRGRLSAKRTQNA